MGKRQLGELQPFELAITLVASELVCIPLADASIPILYGIIPVFTLFLVHILITKLATKSVKFRKFLNGKPVIIIEKGNILPAVMQELNMNIDDIMEALRGAGYFNPSEVEYAILETNGNMSVLPKSQNKPLSPEDLDMHPQASTLPVTVIMEGEFIGENIAQLDGITKEKVLCYLDTIGLKQQDILVLLVSGTDIYIQPYRKQFVMATLNLQQDATSPATTLDTQGEESEDQSSQNQQLEQLKDMPQQSNTESGDNKKEQE